MALCSTYLLLLSLLVSVRSGYMKLEDRPCSSAEQQQFLDAYCQNVPNSTVIAKQNDFTETFGSCYDTYMIFFEIGTKYLEILKMLVCKEIDECLGAIWSVISVCAHILEKLLPPELKDPNSQTKFLEILDRIKRILPAFCSVLGILFIVGIAANGFLVMIFSRHQRVRNDVMLINLTVADVLCLVINLPIFIMLISLQTSLITEMFKAFTFGSRLCIFISEYSLVIISFQRFRAVSKMTVIRNEKTCPNWIKLTCLWILGCLYGLCHYLFLEAFQNNWIGFANILKVAYILTYIMIAIEGVFPVVLIAVFSVLASKRLKKMAKNFPGETSHHLERIRDRYLAAKALIALVVLFVFSYVPYHIALATFLNYYSNPESFFTNILDFETWAYVILSCYTIMFLTSALNPLVLYFLSSKFRRYFNSYFYCRTHELDEIPLHQIN